MNLFLYACERQRHCVIEVNAERIEQEQCIETAKLHNLLYYHGLKNSVCLSIDDGI